jgi:hypothetical protein
MTARVLPAPEVFASCPLDGKILQHYAGTFEAVYVSLNPFIRPVGIDSAEFKPGTYPNRASIVKNCEPVLWSEVLQQTNLPSIAAVDIALRTQIGGLRKDLENQNYAAAIEALAVSQSILPPNEGLFSELLHDRILKSIQGLGYEWLWIGDEFDTERKLRWIEDLKSQEDGLTLGRCGRSTGTVISHFFVRRTKD